MFERNGVIVAEFESALLAAFVAVAVNGGPRAGTQWAKVLAYVTAQPGAWTPQAIAADLGLPVRSIYESVRSLRNSGRIAPPTPGTRALYPRVRA